MSETNDISRLFSRFGGHPDQYHEIGRDNLARSSEARWPLLASVARETAKMQAVRDMGHASPAMEFPASASPVAAASAATAPAAAALRASNGSPEPRPLAQPGIFADAREPGSIPMPGAAASPEGKTPLAQFIAPRRRTSPPQVGVVPDTAQPPAQVFRHRPVPPPPETRATARDWRADMAPCAAPAFLNHPEATRPGVQTRTQSPLQAVFSRLERAGGNDAAGIHAGSEASGTRASIFERLARR